MKKDVKKNSQQLRTEDLDKVAGGSGGYTCDVCHTTSWSSTIYPCDGGRLCESCIKKLYSLKNGKK